MSIPNEAVEAAAGIILAGIDDGHQDAWKIARAALEAAAPDLMAAAWEEGYRGCYERYMYEPVPTNPYRDAGAGE